MALQFPASPADGDVYPAAPNSEYIYSDAKGAWLSLPNQDAKTVTSDTAPANPKDGDQWFKTTDGTFYIYVVDPDGGQWVESQAPITANGYYSPNYIINGAFDILQRGVSFTNLANETYHADRWKQNGDGSGFTKIWTSEVFSPGTAPATSVPGTVYMRFNQTVAGTGATYNNPFKQPIESVRGLEGQTVTVSFWAKADASRFITPSFQQVFGTGGSSPVYTVGTPVTLNTSWTRYSQTFNIPSISGKTLGANNFLELYFTVANNTVQTIDMWGVQLEQGSIATTFRRNANSLQGELAACQRYYYRINSALSSSLYGPLGIATRTSSSTLAYGIIKHPVQMRTTPVGAWSNVTGFTLWDVGAHVLDGIYNDTRSDVAATIGLTSTGFVPGYSGSLHTNAASVNNWISFDAEF